MDNTNAFDTSSFSPNALFILILLTVIIALVGLLIILVTRGFWSFIIRTILVVCVAIFALCNYKILSFESGMSELQVENKAIISTVDSLPRFKKIEYYKNPISSSKDIEYVLIVTTTYKNYAGCISENDLEILSTDGYFSNDVKPQKITPIPIYVELLAILLIVSVVGKKKKLKKVKATSAAPTEQKSNLTK